MLRVFSLTATAVLALVLWVVPSVGTLGQGTIGDRFAHVDRTLVSDDVAGRTALARADRATAAVVARF
ncbi:MAG: hypothetical protein H7268_15885 [Sandarakinorhabdus sp.]|nr:hypothetical protein [Sandarakinorhabdus sp.]